MARYGAAIYGEDTYGSTTGGTNNVLWGLEIDWDGDGYFDGTNEAQYMRNLSWNRGRKHYIKTDGNGFEQPGQGSATFELINTDGRYDPNNASSPLYPNVEPGKYVQIKVKSGESGTPEYIFSGKIETIEPIDSGQAVLITAYDGIKHLREADVTQSIQEDIKTGAAIDLILTAARYPTLWGDNLDLGNDTIQYWWVSDKNAFNAIDDVIQEECGRIAIEGDGKFRFLQRSTLTASTATVSQSEMLKDIKLLQPWEVVRNVFKINVFPKVEHSTSDLWTLNDKPLIAAGQTLTVWGRYSYNNRSVSALTVTDPEATTDYTMNTLEDGTGVDLTSSFTVTATKFGESVKLEITNSGASGGYVTLLKIRGTPLDSPNSTYVEVDDSGTGQKRIFTINSPWMQSTSKAGARATWLKNTLNQSRKYPVFQMESQPAKQFSFDLLDRITLDIDKYGIDADYIVSGIEGQWLSDNGQAVLTTVYAEPFPTYEESFWQFTAKFPAIFF